MDKQFIFDLMEKFSSSDINKLTLNLPDQGEIKLDKNIRGAAYTSAPVAVAPVAHPHHLTAEHATVKSEDIATDHEIITSPIVGTFYRSPAPDAPSFIQEGDTVSTGKTLCIIEAMKLMNELEAEFSCKIVKVLAESGAMVEYGTPLFEVKRV